MPEYPPPTPKLHQQNCNNRVLQQNYRNCIFNYFENNTILQFCNLYLDNKNLYFIKIFYCFWQIPKNVLKRQNHLITLTYWEEDITSIMGIQCKFSQMTMMQEIQVKESDLKIFISFSADPHHILSIFSDVKIKPVKIVLF